jgi:hypothetical protein
MKLNSPLTVIGRFVRRPDLNNPPTARNCPCVGFPGESMLASGRGDLNHPPTAVNCRGWDFEFHTVLMARVVWR